MAPVSTGTGIANLAAFYGVHVLCLAAFFTGVDTLSLAICVIGYIVRMFAVTGGYHRYFAHRTYKMGRISQFFMAFLAMTSAQKGVIWWAAHHRWHHKYSDMPQDVHSVRQRGFYWAHMGWVVSDEWDGTKHEWVKDLEKFPELVWLDRYPLLPAFVAGFLCWLVGGWSGLIVGYFWSTVLLWHGTFTINSLSHVWGSRRFATTDDSRNNPWLAIITLGEGWHNNHHRFQASVRQGFYWWEYDITYYVLWLLSKVGIVWDLKPVPEKVLAEGRMSDGNAPVVMPPTLLPTVDWPALLAEAREGLAEAARAALGRIDGAAKAALGPDTPEAAELIAEAQEAYQARYAEAEAALNMRMTEFQRAMDEARQRWTVSAEEWRDFAARQTQEFRQAAASAAERVAMAGTTLSARWEAPVVAAVAMGAVSSSMGTGETL